MPPSPGSLGSKQLGQGYLRISRLQRGLSFCSHIWVLLWVPGPSSSAPNKRQIAVLGSIAQHGKMLLEQQERHLGCWGVPVPTSRQKAGCYLHRKAPVTLEWKDSLAQKRPVTLGKEKRGSLGTASHPALAEVKQQDYRNISSFPGFSGEEEALPQ